MRFTDNASITSANMANDDILAGTDVSASADKKFSLANIADWLLNKFNGLSLAGSSQTVKSALDSLNSNLSHFVMPSNNAIPSGTTVEQYADTLEKGFYIVCTTATSTALAQGMPIASPFTIYITVYSKQEHIQMIAESFNPSASISGDTLYIKRKYGGTWHDWVKMPTRSEIDSLNSNSYLLAYGTRIPNGTDINTLVTPGHYYCPSGTAAATLTNCPVNTSFIMNVEFSTGNDANYVRQTITVTSSAGGIIEHMRTTGNKGSTWTAWASMPTRAEMDGMTYIKGESVPTSTPLEGAYGFITGGGNTLWIFVPMQFANGVSVNTNSVTSLTLSLRTIGGAYVGGADNFDAKAYLSNAYTRPKQGLLVLQATKSDGWGATNNTPVVGRVTAAISIPS